MCIFNKILGRLLLKLKGHLVTVGIQNIFYSVIHQLFTSLIRSLDVSLSAYLLFFWRSFLSIRQNKNFKGWSYFWKMIIFAVYAYDITLSLKNKGSIIKLMELFDKFCVFSDWDIRNQNSRIGLLKEIQLGLELNASIQHKVYEGFGRTLHL